MTVTVALTFDDGPSEWTGPMLEVLAKHDAHATFFVLGSQIQGREALLQWMIEAGHEIGVHGWDHTPVDDLTLVLLRRQIEETAALIAEAVEGMDAAPVRWWRPPWHRLNTDAVTTVTELGYSYCRTTLDGHDVSRAEEQIVGSVIRQLRDGAIIGLHDGIAANGQQHVTHRMGTVRAADRILAHCRSVTVSELLA